MALRTGGCTFYAALLNVDAADQVIQSYPQVEHWYVGGHSMGGVAACQYAEKHASELSGVLLLASFANKDLSQTALDVVCAHGTKDGVLNMKSHDDSMAMEPSSFRELIIEGGNHAQFGDYGDQLGDGVAEISAETQQRQTVEFLVQGIGKL